MAELPVSIDDGAGGRDLRADPAGAQPPKGVYGELDGRVKTLSWPARCPGQRQLVVTISCIPVGWIWTFPPQVTFHSSAGSSPLKADELDPFTMPVVMPR